MTGETPLLQFRDRKVYASNPAEVDSAFYSILKGLAAVVVLFVLALLASRFH